MANCFQLFRKGETEPMSLVKVDEEICRHFNAPVDPEKWFHNWYNTIGFCCAMGKTWDEIREVMETPMSIAIVDFLEANFTTTAWYSPGK